MYEEPLKPSTSARWFAHAGCALVLAAMAACAAATPPITYSVMPTALTPVDADRNKAKEFARVFCASLGHFKDKDGHAWGECEKYLEMTDAAQAQAQIATPYRFPFSTSIAHLKDAHRLDIDYFAVAPYGSSEENGKSIARHIDDALARDKTHRYVVIGYDKGAADLQEALRALEAPKTKVAGLVSVAGIVGGLWLPDLTRALMEPTRPWIAASCPGNMQDGVHSIVREVRQAFLRENPPPVPSYSIVAASAYEETSSALRPAWKRLSLYAKEQDGQIVAWEQVLPGAKYLGTAHADHWSIALPFDEAPQKTKAIDRNHFPRDALLEAIVRFVSADLQATEPTR
jgi:hypothetical protein